MILFVQFGNTWCVTYIEDALSVKSDLELCHPKRLLILTMAR